MSKDTIAKRSIEKLENSGARLMREQRARLEIFLGEVEFWSSRTHLVGRARVGDNIEGLLRDSWALWEFASDAGLLDSPTGEGREKKDVVRAADIGAGAGFPGVVWKIADPEIDVTLYERKKKAALFLERSISLLNIEGIRVVAEDAAMETACFDVVVSKAAGKLPSLLPIADKILRKGGAYITVKGGGWEEELDGIRLGGMGLKKSRRIRGGRGTMLLFIKK